MEQTPSSSCTTIGETRLRSNQSAYMRHTRHWKTRVTGFIERSLSVLLESFRERKLIWFASTSKGADDRFRIRCSISSVVHSLSANIRDMLACEETMVIFGIAYTFTAPLFFPQILSFLSRTRNQFRKKHCLAQFLWKHRGGTRSTFVLLVLSLINHIFQALIPFCSTIASSLAANENMKNSSELSPSPLGSLWDGDDTLRIVIIIFSREVSILIACGS